MLEIINFLFQPFLTCCLMIGIFGYFGIHVLKREIIFIDIALAQLAAVGSALAFIIWSAPEDSIIAYLSAFGFTILAALFYSFTNRKIVEIPQEAIIGVSYAIAAAAALFLLSMAAGGDVHLEEMLTGSILWAKWTDIITCVCLYGIVGAFHFIFRKKFITVSNDYRNSSKTDRNLVIWDFLFYITLGIVITYSIRIAGVLVVFSFLIIPATFSALFAKRWNVRLVIAWCVGVFSSVAGLYLSYLFDFSSGPSVVTILGVSLVVAVFIRKLAKI